MEMIMKTVLFACALLEVAMLSDVAMASSRSLHARAEDKAFAAFSATTLSSPHLVRSGNDCATDRASPVFGPNGGTLGYECISSAGSN
jgi:hypothetical protein